MLLIISAKMAHSLWRYISFSAEYTAVSQPVNKPSRVDAKTFDKNDVQLISQQNWFGKYQPVAAQVKQPEPVPVAETRLNVVLRGIAFGARPGAVIEEGGKQQVYLQGETLGSHNAVIEEINRDHVMLRYQGKIERLSLAEEERSTVAVTNKKAVSDEAKQAVAEPAVSVPVEIPAAVRQALAKDPQKIFNYIQLTPVRKEGISLVAWCEASLEILHVHPLSLSVLQELQRGLNAPFTLRQIDGAEFEQRLNAVWQRDSSEARQLMEDLGSAEDFFTLAEELPETEDLLESDDDAPIIKLINAMLAEAIKEGASDIHIETFEKSLVIRFRVDGTLHEMLRPGRKLASLLVSRIKVMARLDIAEKRVPQDGRIALLLGGRAIDVRVSTMPSAWGERVVLRLLDKNQARLTLERLGLSQQLTAQLRQLLHKPHGIFLVTGPTGSGKSTTLYAGLQELNNHSRNILTVEDPIEYMIEGIGQTQVNTRVGMTFARGLRAILRQDPDVVMVGEIRDTETAEIAVQASLTGHLVLSTLHTNTAVGAITRLQDMGVEPFLLSSSLTGVMAQRLVRTLCPDCRQPAPATDEEKRLLGITDARTVTLYHPQGCPACNHKGFRGRTAIHELIVVDATLRDLIHRQAGELELERYVRQHSAGIRSNGIEKVLAGETSLDEVLRVTMEA